MQTPLQITFHNLAHSPAIEARIRERAAKIEKRHDDILGCRVSVELEHKHHRRGNHYRVKVDVTVPDAEIVANREPGEHHAYEDVYVAIRDAFDAAERQLEEYVQRRGRHVKAHAAPPQGRVD